MLHRALELLDIAAKTEPNAMLVSFLRFKVHLERGSASAAVDELRHMMRCEDFEKEHMKVMAVERLAAPKDCCWTGLEVANSR